MRLNPKIEGALETDRVVDITTTGRSSGQPRRIETWLHRYEGQLYLYGSAGRRDWVANLRANPDLTIHLKGSVVADVPATASWVEDASLREAAIGYFVETYNVDAADRARFLAECPLFVLEIEGFEQPR